MAKVYTIQVVIRPLAVFNGGALNFGAGLEWRGDAWEVVAGEGEPEPFYAFPAFLNAHSHLEYFDLIGRVATGDYFQFIRGITAQKQTRTPEEVQRACLAAATANRAAGFATVIEHSHWEGAAAAMAAHGLSGIVYREVITIGSDLPWPEQLRRHEEQRQRDAAQGIETGYAPHTPYTVSAEAIEDLAGIGLPLSIHAAESSAEMLLFESGEGQIAEFLQALGRPLPETGCSPIEYLDSLGALTAATQLVHCCYATDGDISLMAERGASVAHCPRSNTALGCAPAPIRRMFDAGASVGLGQDSAASSGPIDAFAEMRAAVELSHLRGEPITTEEALTMACGDWSAAIALPALELEDVLNLTPQEVRWLEPNG